MDSEPVPPKQSVLRRAERDAAASQLETLQREIEEYEALRAGEVPHLRHNHRDIITPGGKEAY